MFWSLRSCQVGAFFDDEINSIVEIDGTEESSICLSVEAWGLQINGQDKWKTLMENASKKEAINYYLVHQEVELVCFQRIELRF